MKFGPIPVSEAQGCLLGHGVRHAGGVFRKGRVLSADDIAVLREAGVETVMAARFEDGDVPEDEAAGILASALAGRFAEMVAPFTGRANIHAGRRGIAMIDAGLIDALNGLDESLTVATIAPFDLVEERQMLATIKVIPFSVPRTVLDRAVALCRGRPGIAVTPLTGRSVGLVLTRLPGAKASLIGKAREAVAARVEALSGEIGGTALCDHETGAVARAIGDLYRKGLRPILVFGASAIVDRNDVIPAGLVAAGGEVRHLGMPVDPGNLLMLGALGDCAVVGVPSCARSPKVNGFDWVLQRLMADLDVEPADIMVMGVGGLLKEIPSRPQPREGARVAKPKSAPRIAALVLAAGRSTRMGGPNKLLLEISGQPMVAHAVAAVRASKAAPVVVVTGHQADAVRAALAGFGVTFAHNGDYEQGISTSLKAGLAALPDDVDGVVVCLGDMPGVGPQHIDRLIAAFDPVEGRAICVPVMNGKRGNPVLWARAFFDEMAAVKGDVGARHLIGANEERVCEVAIDDDAVLNDIDTPDMFAAHAKRGSAPGAGG